MLTERQIMELKPEDMTDEICKLLYTMCYDFDEYNDYILNEESFDKIGDLMNDETFLIFNDWRCNYNNEQELAHLKYLTTTKDGKIVPVKESKIKVISAKDLMEKDIPELKWLVDDLLPEQSVSLVVAPPKSYKSFLCIDLCLSIATGKSFLSKQTHKHDVLYFDLESTERRPRDRIKLISGGEKPPDNFFIYTAGDVEVGQIGNGFENSIKQVFEDHKGIALVIVDIFQYIRPKHSKSQNAYDSDYEDLKTIKKLAVQYNTAFLLVHHARKMKDPQDVFNNASGSSGLFGAVDCMIMIDKDKRDDEFATFHITGRDIESLELRMRFDKQTCKWQYIGTEREIVLQEREKAYSDSNIIKSIKKELEQNNGVWQGTLSELKKDSKYFQCNINDDIRIIAKLIREYNDLLSRDNIGFTIERKKVNRQKEYRFSYI